MDYEVGLGKPYTTIQSALDQIEIDGGGVEFTARHDVVIYPTLSYDEAVNISANTKPSSIAPLYIRSNYDGTRAVVDCTTVSSTFVVDTPWVIFDYLGIKNTSVNPSGQTMAIYLAANYCRIRRCSIFDVTNVQDGYAIDAQSANTSWHEFYNNIFYNNRTLSLILGDGPVSICNNTFYQNTIGAGATLGTCVGAYLDASETAFINNIFYTDGSAISCLYDMSGAADWYVSTDYNNFYTINGSILEYTQSIATLTDWQNYLKGSHRDLNSFATNPQFINLPGNDFHLRHSSPCKKSGWDLSGTGLVDDYDGTLRLPPYDIGAYEIPNLVADKREIYLKRPALIVKERK